VVQQDPHRQSVAHRGGWRGLSAPSLVRAVYTDIADVADDMTNRFELEINMSHANVMWRDEVSANIGTRIAAPSVNAD
jgi:hypothetical protein